MSFQVNANNLSEMILKSDHKNKAGTDVCQIDE